MPKNKGAHDDTDVHQAVRHHRDPGGGRAHAGGQAGRDARAQGAAAVLAGVPRGLPLHAEGRRLRVAGGDA